MKTYSTARGFGPRFCFVGSCLLVFLAACATRGPRPLHPVVGEVGSNRTAQNQELLPTIWSDYLEALNKGNGGAAVELLSATALDAFERLRIMAVAGSREELDAEPAYFQYLVLRMRAEFGAEQLRRWTGRTVLARMIEFGWIAQQAAEARFVRGEEKEAWGQLVRDGSPLTGEIRLWVRENGRWKLDLADLMALASYATEQEVLRQVAEGESSREAVLASLVEASNGQTLPLEVWDAPVDAPDREPLPWVAKDPASWPQIVLTNQVELADGTSRQGQHAFFVRLGERAYVATAAAAVRGLTSGEAQTREPGEEPPATDWSSWSVYPFLQPEKAVRVRLSATASVAPTSGWVLMEPRHGEAPAQALVPRSEDAFLGETVYVLGCPSTASNCQQQAFRGSVFRHGANGQFAIELADRLELSGIDGAPVVDSHGYLLGVVASDVAREGDGKGREFVAGARGVRALDVSAEASSR